MNVPTTPLPAGRKDLMSKMNNMHLGCAITILATTLLMTGCAQPLPNLPSGAAAYAQVPVAKSSEVREYRIGPLDTISINVFQEADLSLQAVPVDSSGSILLPLVGTIEAAGKSTRQLAGEIASRLNERYLRNPQVTVTVQNSAQQRVTVEGEVTQPGIYQIQGRTTLIDALALARGPTRNARLREVVIFREIDGVHSGALFNLQAIRRGEQPDPEVLPGDQVVVGLSSVKAGVREALTASPFLAVFVQLL